MLNISRVGMEFKGLNNENIVALNDVSFQVNDGDFICIIGPSGCGKSTLLRIIAGLQPGYTGNIEYSGKNAIKMNTSMVFQEHALFPWLTVSENVGYGLKLQVRKKENLNKTKDKVMKYLELCRISESADFKPYQLSGGMRQRAAVARALAVEPEVLLMDEPFSALDPLSRSQLQDEVIRIHEMKKIIVLFVTHSVEEAILLSDRIIVLTSRPGSVKEIIPVPAPHPRNLDDPDMIKLKRHISEISGVMSRVYT